PSALVAVTGRSKPIGSGWPLFPTQRTVSCSVDPSYVVVPKTMDPSAEITEANGEGADTLNGRNYHQFHNGSGTKTLSRADISLSRSLETRFWSGRPESQAL